MGCHACARADNAGEEEGDGRSDPRAEPAPAFKSSIVPAIGLLAGKLVILPYGFEPLQQE